MANPTVSVSVQTSSATVPRNTSYQFNFNVNEPTQAISQTNAMNDGGILGSGHLFSYAIDKTQWSTINRLGVS